LHRQVVLDALDMALWQRQPSGVIHHSDQGGESGSTRTPIPAQGGQQSGDCGQQVMAG
jgi:DNA polymerase IIIc chi subunit